MLLLNYLLLLSANGPRLLRICLLFCVITFNPLSVFQSFQVVSEILFLLADYWWKGWMSACKHTLMFLNLKTQFWGFTPTQFIIHIVFSLKLCNKAQYEGSTWLTNLMKYRLERNFSKASPFHIALTQRSRSDGNRLLCVGWALGFLWVCAA